MKAINTYSRWLMAYPYRTKMITSGLIFGLSDVIIQKGMEKKEDFDTERALKFCGIGGLFVAPVLHKWFGTALPAWYKHVL